MKMQLFTGIFYIVSVALFSQGNGTDLLQDLEKSQPSTQELQITATLKSASRLFAEKEDLTSVIVVIPSGSVVNITGIDSTYYRVIYDEDEGYIFKKDARLNNPAFIPESSVQQKQVQQESNPVEKQLSHLEYLRNKYGTTLAASLYSHKIWKGMTSQMVRDSWGPPLKINRDIGGNTIREEWVYKTTWLFIENNTLVDWGPVKN